MVQYIPAIAAGITGGIKAISAGSQLKKDKAELARLTPAFYKVQNEYYDNYNQASELAQSGLTSSAKDFYSDMASRGLGSAIGGLNQAGGSPNDIAMLFDSYNNSIRNLGVADSEEKIKNIKYFQTVGKDLAGQKTTQWAINEYQPYQNKLKELTQRIAADKKNIWGGIDQVIGAGQSAVTAGQNQQLLNSLFKAAPSGGNAGADQGVTIDNGLEDPYPGIDPNMTASGGGFNWYRPESNTPIIP